MKIIISAKSNQLEGSPDERFGRAAWLIKVDSATGEWQAFPNPGANQSGGAGVAAAQFVIDQKADAVISGDFGPHASRALKAAHIEMYILTGAADSLKKAMELFSQSLLPVFQP
ncbi:MAG: hypothetical protein BGO78_03080 [Chloroflexi bacterium 44-23]|nr:MAG: hypothetical protein BGO78_03080 [Chloroflexi bacterium 44-23]